MKKQTVWLVSFDFGVSALRIAADSVGKAAEVAVEIGRAEYAKGADARRKMQEQQFGRVIPDPIPQVNQVERTDDVWVL